MYRHDKGVREAQSRARLGQAHVKNRDGPRGVSGETLQVRSRRNNRRYLPTEEEPPGILAGQLGILATEVQGSTQPSPSVGRRSVGNSGTTFLNIRDLVTFAVTFDDLVISRLDGVRDFQAGQHIGAVLEGISQFPIVKGRKWSLHGVDDAVQTLSVGKGKGWKAQLYDKGAELKDRVKHAEKREHLVLQAARMQSHGMLRFEVRMRSGPLRDKELNRVGYLTQERLDTAVRRYFSEILELDREIVGLTGARIALREMCKSKDRTTRNAALVIATQSLGVDVPRTWATRKIHRDVAETWGFRGVGTTREDEVVLKLDYDSGTVVARPLELPASERPTTPAEASAENPTARQCRTHKGGLKSEAQAIEAVV